MTLISLRATAFACALISYGACSVPRRVVCQGFLPRRVDYVGVERDSTSWRVLKRWRQENFGHLTIKIFGAIARAKICRWGNI